MLLKHYAKCIDGADAGREASKPNSLFGEFGQILATEIKKFKYFNDLMELPTGVVLGRVDEFNQA